MTARKLIVAVLVIFAAGFFGGAWARELTRPSACDPVECAQRELAEMRECKAYLIMYRSVLMKESFRSR
jgi:hypothetical protein